MPLNLNPMLSWASFPSKVLPPTAVSVVGHRTSQSCAETQQSLLATRTSLSVTFNSCITNVEDILRCINRSFRDLPAVGVAFIPLVSDTAPPKRRVVRMPALQRPLCRNTALVTPLTARNTNCTQRPILPKLDVSPVWLPKQPDTNAAQRDHSTNAPEHNR